MSGEQFSGDNHLQLGRDLCAYRLDKSVPAEAYVDILERYEAAVRQDERHNEKIRRLKL